MWGPCASRSLTYGATIGLPWPDQRSVGVERLLKTARRGWGVFMFWSCACLCLAACVANSSAQSWRSILQWAGIHVISTCLYCCSLNLIWCKVVVKFRWWKLALFISLARDTTYLLSEDYNIFIWGGVVVANIFFNLKTRNTAIIANIKISKYGNPFCILINIENLDELP